MTPRRAKRIILLAIIVAGTIAFVRQAAEGEIPSVRIAVGGFVALIMLTLIAEAAPEVAAGFAMLTLVSSIFVTGEPALSAITSALTSGEDFA